MTMVSLEQSLWSTVQNSQAMVLGGAAELIDGLAAPDLPIGGGEDTVDVGAILAGADIIPQEGPLAGVIKMLRGQMMAGVGSELLKVSAHQRQAAAALLG